ncbi:MAG: hypothetical protein HY539_01795 [Deltaproteobacteria bacterium]|nr:hypothetical protein [Deltaproteobacteria bacterium]
MTPFIRRREITPHIVFSGAVSGSGKSAVCSILSSLNRVEIRMIDHYYDDMCIVRYFDRITEDAATAMLRNHADVACYYQMIGRHVNFRPTDATSVLSKREIYEERMRLPDGPPTLERIRKEQPILHLAIHDVIGLTQPLFNAFGDRMTFIEIVRHPLQMVPHWCSFVDRYGQDPMEFQLCCDHRGRDIPFFAVSWAEEWRESNRIDRTIRAFKFFRDLRSTFLESLEERFKKRFFTVSFENFVHDPWPFIRKFEEILNTLSTPLTKKILEEQKIPRGVLANVPDHAHFKRYGTQSLQERGITSDREALDKNWAFVRGEASPECLRILESLSIEYEKTYGRVD